MSKKKDCALTEEEIEEELINNDLINSGGLDTQETLQHMDLEDKKNLLHCIKQSKEDLHHETSPQSRHFEKPTSSSSSEFPPLASTTGKSNKLKLQRKPSSSSKTDIQEQCINLLDENNDSVFPKLKRFSLPYCVSDNAPPLPMPDRALRRDVCPYYQMRGETGKEALRRMLAHHDAWKEKYISETRKLESRALGENIHDIEDRESKSEENDDNEDDPFCYTEDFKVYSGPMSKKRETKKNYEGSPQNSRSLSRASRDSDCEEIQPILKSEEGANQFKLGEWMVAAAKTKTKRNRKHNSNQARARSETDIEFEFENNRTLWGAGRSGGSPQSPAPSRRSMPMPVVPEVPEEKVQCPICQQNFTISTVENHAATCEGFSSSPMDVEEGS